MATTPHSVGDILDCLDELADENEDVSAGQVMHAFGPRTFGPAIMVPALLEITPIGAIPGVPTFLASVIVLVAAQKMLGRRTLWLPGLIANRHVSAEKLAKSADKLRPLARFMDRHFHRRWQRVTHAPFSQIAAGDRVPALPDSAISGSSAICQQRADAGDCRIRAGGLDA